MSNMGIRQPVCENPVEGGRGLQGMLGILAWQAVLSPTPGASAYLPGPWSAPTLPAS